MMRNQQCGRSVKQESSPLVRFSMCGCLLAEVSCREIPLQARPHRQGGAQGEHALSRSQKGPPDGIVKDLK